MTCLKEKRLDAEDVRQFVAINNDEIIAYGFGKVRTYKSEKYALLTIWFSGGKLHRTLQNTDGKVVKYDTCGYFDCRFFHEYVHFWYKECTHPMLRKLFHTFGNQLPETSGGKLPEKLPEVKEIFPFDWL